MRIVRHAALLLVLSSSTAFAGPPSDLVRTFYHPVGYEADPAVRDKFTDPAKALFERNDKASDQGEICIDFVPSVDAQDLDQSVVDRTLKLEEMVEGDTAKVTASFMLFADQPDSQRIMLWTLRREAGAWKVADIASQTNGWTLSELGCGEP